MRFTEGYLPPRDRRRVPVGYFSFRSRSSPSSAQLQSTGEITPRTQKVIWLLGGYRRGRVPRLGIVGTRTDLRNWDRVADGKAVGVDKDFFHQQSQNLLAFAHI